jgi:hypothetical protein
MLQWILVGLSLLSYAYNNFQQKGLTTTQNSVNWLYDQNSGKYYYLASNGYYYEYSQPQPPQYQNQVQEQKDLATPYWAQGTQGYGHGQPSQAYAYPQGY